LKFNKLTQDHFVSLYKITRECCLFEI